MNPTSTTNQSAVELCYVLVGELQNGILHAKLSWRHSGSHLSVDFDWHKVLAREEESGDIVGFYHTHPVGVLEPSNRDVRTMLAWSFCFGKPLVCAIATSGRTNAWIFSAADETSKQFEYVELFKQNWIVGTIK